MAKLVIDISSFTWTSRERAGLPLITPPMLIVLQYMRAAKESGWPFIELDDIHMNTVNSLVKRDWIFKSPGTDGVRYSITSRGLKALSVYEIPTEQYDKRRWDGLCKCGQPRKVASTGYVYRQCQDCEREHQRRRYHLKRYRMNPDALCPDCKEKPRLRRPSGHTATYCADCLGRRRREEKRLKRSHLLEQIRAGDVPLCRCGNPVHYTEKSVYNYCWVCWQAYMTQYNDRRRPDSKPAKRRRKEAQTS